MDFLNLWPIDINELIFQHLTGEEILSATLVSNDWSSFLGRSSVFNKKIQIVVQSRRNKSDLASSLRNYGNLRATEDSSELSKDIVQIIANPFNKFSSLFLSPIKFEEEKSLEQIFLNTWATIQQLHLTFEHTSKCDELSASYDFIKLRKLHLAYSNECFPYPNHYFKSFVNMQHLILTNGCDDKFKKLIQSAKKLIKLEISGRFYDINFFKDLSTMPSQLEEFVFNNILSSSKDDKNLSFFNAFFWSQGKTLKRFVTDALLEIEEIFNAFKMPHLQELCLKGFYYDRDIMKIHLENLQIVPPSTPSSLVRLKVDKMDEVFFELLAICAPNLRELLVRELENFRNELAFSFQSLVILRIEYINFELKERICRKSEQERTHLEKLILISNTQ